MEDHASHEAHEQRGYEYLGYDKKSHDSDKRDYAIRPGFLTVLVQAPGNPQASKEPAPSPLDK